MSDVALTFCVVQVLGQSEKNANTDQERSMDGKF